MKTSKLWSLLLVGLVGGLASLSHAGVITQQDNLHGPGYIQPNQVLAGSFDFTGISLPPSEYLTAATVQFDFYDNYDRNQIQRYGSAYSGYNTSLLNPRDDVRISIAGQSAIASSSPMRTLYSSSSRQRLETYYRRESYYIYRTESYSCGIFNRSTCSRTIRETRYRQVPYTRRVTVVDRTTTQGFTGDFSHSLTLPQSLVQRLLSLGSLDFELTGLGVGALGAGTAFLRNASVQLTSASSSVPEPKSLGLVLMGAAGMFVGKRRLGRRS